MRLKFGIAGCGSMGAVYAEICQRHPEIDVVIVADLEPSRAEKLASMSGANAVTALDDGALSALDALIVCVDNVDHASIVRRALPFCSVLCELPAARTAAEARAMEATARDSKTMLAYASLYRLMTPASRFIPDLGDPYLAMATWVRRRTAAGWGPRGRVDRQGGGVSMTLTPSLLDITWWLLGCPEPVEVSGLMADLVGRRATVASQNQIDPSTFEGEDTLAGMVRFEGNLAALLHTAYAAHTPSDLAAHVNVYGSRLGMEIPLVAGEHKPENRIPRVVGEQHGFILDTYLRKPWPPTVKQGYTALVANFVDTLRGTQLPAMPASQGTTLQEMLDGLRWSALNRRSLLMADAPRI